MDTPGIRYILARWIFTPRPKAAGAFEAFAVFQERTAASMQSLRNSKKVALLALLALGGPSLTGCDEAQKLLAELAKQNATGPRKLSDEDAFKYLAKDRASAPETDVDSVSKVIDAQVAAESGQKARKIDDPKVVKLLKSVSHSRRVIQTEKFEQTMDAAVQDYLSKRSRPAFKEGCNDEIDPNDAEIQAEFKIPQIDKIPVRDQKYRGTCAAFTGIGAIEYAAVNGSKEMIGANPSLATLDLSEQRFYWQSKPECQASGACKLPGAGEGSWYGVGFDESAASGVTNIPLEQNCPYQPMPGDTDTYTPQPSTCETGHVGVKKVDYWCGARQIIDWLHKGYAVPYASPLTGNWENNDGLITAKGLAPGETGHAGGHAYLIVGYKKLPDNMAESEGGLCFIIKNSWGEGWGVGGYSCMTLGWMRKVSFEGFFEYQQPIPVEVLLAEELQQMSLPPDEGTPADEVIEEPDTEAEPELPVDDEEDRLDPLPPDLDPNGDVVVDPVEEEPIDEPGTGGESGAGGETGAGGSGGGSDTPDVPGTDVPEPPMDQFAAAKLLGPGRAYYKILTAKEGSELRIKGVLKGGGETKQVRVLLQGSKLVYKGDAVGEYDSGKGVVTLCTEDYTSLCSLRYQKSTKLMYIQFRDEDLRTVKPAETTADKGSWSDVTVSGESYGVFVPEDVLNVDFLLNPKTFVRVGGGEPARLSLRQQKQGGGFGFDLFLSGMQVGEVPFDRITETSLCSGNFSQTCGLVGSNKVDVIPSNLRKLKK